MKPRESMNWNQSMFWGARYGGDIHSRCQFTISDTYSCDLSTVGAHMVLEHVSRHLQDQFKAK